MPEERRWSGATGSRPDLPATGWSVVPSINHIVRCKNPTAGERYPRHRGPQDVRPEEVYHLAAEMGGIGYITGTHAPVARNNTLMNLHMLDASVEAGVERFLFSSSACVYPQHLQEDPDVDPLAEEDAWPAARL